MLLVIPESMDPFTVTTDSYCMSIKFCGLSFCVLTGRKIHGFIFS